MRKSVSTETNKTKLAFMMKCVNVTLHCLGCEFVRQINKYRIAFLSPKKNWLFEVKIMSLFIQIDK
jgi:hypothetical protein